MCCYALNMRPIHTKRNTRESTLEKRFMSEIKKRGGLAIKMPGNIMTGIPDRLVILPGGRIVFVELKTDRGRVSKIQAHVHKLLTELGCHVEVLFGREQIDEFLDNY